MRQQTDGAAMLIQDEQSVKISFMPCQALFSLGNNGATAEKLNLQPLICSGLNGISPRYNYEKGVLISFVRIFRLTLSFYNRLNYIGSEWGRIKRA